VRPSGRYNQIDLHYRTGEFSLEFEGEWDPPVAALFGPSGSGKSTVLEIIAGVRRGARGRVVLDGRTILDTEREIDPPPRRRWIGWVPQDASLFPHLSVHENVRYGLVRGGGEGARRLASAIEVLELQALLSRRASSLSGGERQRVAVARAIASGARVLLLDEPLASLDVPLRSRVFPLFLRLRDELQLPMIYVSHDAEEVLGLAAYVLVIEQGRCVASGRTEDVLGGAVRSGALEVHAAENRFSVRLLETHPRDGTAIVELTSGLRLLMSATPPPARERFEVAIREEEIILALAPPGPVSAQNVIEGRVGSVREMEGHAWVGVETLEAASQEPRTGSTFTARITRRALSALGLEPGRAVWLIFKASSVRPLTRTDRP